LYAWGHNDCGQLGDGTNIDRNKPVEIGTGYTAISAGDNHSLALMGDTVYAWGEFPLGDGTNKDSKTPVRIDSGYTAISAGGGHSHALKGNTLYAWGGNSNGKLGDGSTTTRYIPVLIGTGFTAISAGDKHCLALKGNTLYAWGENYQGELGIGTDDGEKSSPVMIGTGYTAVAAGYGYSLALKGNTLYAWGTGCYLDDRSYKPHEIGTGYTAISAGADHSLVLKGSDLYAFGFGWAGQIGDGNNSPRDVPTLVKFPGQSTNPTTNPTSVTLNKVKAEVKVGSSITLKATVSPSGADKKVTWSSDNKKIATVSSGGVVKGIKEGKATITVKTVNGKTAKCVVTVKKK